MIAACHAALGIEVLRRGIIFIDLAVAQIAGLGIVAASLIVDAPAWWAVQGTALACAIAAACFFHWTEKRLPDQQEAIIGSSYVVAASAALLLLADHPHGGDEVRHLLAGQILFVTWHDVLTHAPVYLLVLAAWLASNAARRGIWFFVLFALAITSSVQLVGVFVVFASLILPALAVAGQTRIKLVSAWAVAAAAVVIGTLVSVFGDLPTGPTLVLAFAATTVVYRRLATAGVMPQASRAPD